MPPAFLVLHESLITTLIVQGDVLDTAPVGLSGACWRTQVRIPDQAPYQGRDLPVQVKHWLQRLCIVSLPLAAPLVDLLHADSRRYVPATQVSLVAVYRNDVMKRTIYPRGQSLLMVHRYLADVDAQMGRACLDPKGPPQGASPHKGPPRRQVGRPTRRANIIPDCTQQLPYSLFASTHE